jgi:tungstate transport system substrate-binding protein
VCAQALGEMGFVDVWVIGVDARDGRRQALSWCGPMDEDKIGFTARRRVQRPSGGPRPKTSSCWRGTASRAGWVAWDHFIIVGPTTDPAHIAGGHDAVSALKAIAVAKAPFVSRGDRSGTDACEKRLWHYTRIEPVGSWYRAIGSGMAATLKAASAMHAYTLSDSGTWLSFKNKDDLEVMVEGDAHLVNRYDVILLDPTRHPEAKIDAAYRLADWLLSPTGQAAIGSYEIGGEQLFHPFATEP